MARNAGTSRTLRSVMTVAAAALLAVGCGKPEPSPEYVVVPQTIGVIRSAERHADGWTIGLVRGGTVELEHDRFKSLGGSGNLEPGNMLLVGELQGQTAIAVLGPFLEHDPALGSAWWAIAPAWITETDVLFTSGLRLRKSPGFKVGPQIQRPGESGYAITGTFLVDGRGVVLEMR